MALMNKSAEYAKQKRPLSILSATWAENIDNFIFVEAYKIDSVRDAINGLTFCYQKIDILPLNEMTKVYDNQDSQIARPVEKHWVRIKGGLYKDDLGIVDKYDREDKIYVRLIPRIDPNT